MATNAQLVKAIQDLTARVVKLEARPAGNDYSASIAALGQADVALDARVDKLETLTCPEAERFKVIESALGILNSDHIPV